MARKKKSSISIPWTYIISVGAAVLFTWLLHELVHFAAGEFLGNDMKMSFNSSGVASGHYDGQWHETIVSAVGPIVTFVEAWVFYYLLKRDGDEHLFPVLLTCLYMRTLAGAMNFIRLNDEGRVGNKLGIGTYTISIIICAIMFWWVRDVVKSRQFSASMVIGTLLGIIFFSSLLILGDQFLTLRIV